MHHHILRPHRCSFGSNLLQIAVFVFLLPLQASFCLAAQTDASSQPPFPTGSHLQLVRDFYTTAEGLLSNDVRAVTITRQGQVFALADKTLARLQGQRFVPESCPEQVTALFAPEQGPQALAGASNGVWTLLDGQWQRQADSPVWAIGFATEPDGHPWALAPSGVWRWDQHWKRVHSVDDDDMAGPRRILPGGPEDVLLAADSGLFGLMGKRRYWLRLEVRPGALLSSNVRDLARLDSFHFLAATDKGLNISTGGAGWQAVRAADGLPVLDLTHVAVGPDGTVWLGSEHGLIRWRNGQWTYLEGKRWLPDDRVTAIGPAPDGSVWVGTGKGLSHIYQRKLTMEEKAAFLQKKLESRDRRQGYVTLMHLRSPGVVEGALQEVSDNDGLWTALYIAAESYRYAATKSPEAKAQAWRATQALLRLESITGISGFPARAICGVKEPQFAANSLRSNKEWHESTIEKDWFWKGETSSDELDGHYFGWYLFYELAANDKEKKEVRATCKRVTDHILDHGYHLVDKDGTPTTWGVWTPEKLNDDPKWWQERGLGSLEILSHLKVAHHLVGDPRYEKAYRELIQRHHYAVNTLDAKIPGSVSHDNQLLFLSYYPLLQLERDPKLRVLYTTSIRRTWDTERLEGSPLWNFIYGTSTGDPCEVEAAVAALREIPLDFILWKTDNSHRVDLKFDPVLEQQGLKRLAKPLCWTERVIHKWDKSPFILDAGSDMIEGDPTIWLLPYWMGRYHQLIE